MSRSEETAHLAVDVLIIGAGPTGLTAADSLVATGASVAVVERTGYVGGLARPATVSGNQVDLGGHRLLSATPDQRRAWLDFSERLGGIPLSDIGRRSGILRDGYVVAYPFDWRQFRDSVPWPVRARGVASLIGWKLRAPGGRADHTLDDWVKNRYGPFLSQKFMAPHARKVFGVDPSDIPAVWAAQRILEPRFTSLLATALPRRRRSPRADDFPDRFFYPHGGAGVLWARLAEILGDRVRWLFEAGVTSIVRSGDGRFAVTVSGAGTDVTVSCARIISTGRPEDLALSLGLDDLAATIAGEARRRDLVVGVVRVHDYPPNWHGYQWLYTHDTGIRAHRLNNYGEWETLDSDVGVIGLEYTVPTGTTFDVAATAVKDMAILLPGGVVEFLGSEVTTDAYSNFGASADQLALFDEELRRFGGGIISTGRQGAGIYINLDQAMRLGARVAAMSGEHTGVVGRDEYSPYQEKVG